MARQIRRYELVPELQEEFLRWWQAIPGGRANYGMRVVSAHIDRAKHEFTWIVEADGDNEAFAAAEAAWFSSPERAALFAGVPNYAAVMHVSMVETIL
jgi:hypothetical protein